MTTGKRIGLAASRAATVGFAVTIAAFNASAQVARVTVETLDDSLTGVLASFDSKSDLHLQQDNHIRLPVSEVMRLEFRSESSQRNETRGQSGELTLVDGARFVYQSCQQVEGALVLKALEGAEAEVSLSSVRSWWLGVERPVEETLRETGSVADLLWVKPRRGEGVSSVAGVVLGVDRDGVRFAFDSEDPSDTILVPWERLAGLEFFHESGAERPPACLVSLRSGGRVVADAVRLEDDRLVWESDNGRGGLPLSSVEAIDLSAGRVRAVSALKLLGASWRPYFDVGGAEEGYALDTSLGGEPIRLREPDPRSPLAWPAVGIVREHASGVAMKSRGELRFAMPAQAVRLKGRIGLDPNCARSGSAEATVLADGSVIWSGVVDGATRPVELNAPLEGAATLTLRVDYGDNLDAGDHVHFAGLRVIQ